MTLPSPEERIVEKTSKHAEIASFVGKILRENFGKGPGSVYVSISDTFVTIYVNDFISPMEQVLFNENHGQTVEKTRSYLMESISTEIKTYIKLITGIDIKEFYYDWSLENQSGLFLGVGDKEGIDYPSYIGKEKVHKEIKRMSEKAEKEPNEVNSLRINSRTLIVIRKGILVEIEKALIQNGHEEALRLTKGKLEKRLLHQNELNSALDGELVDVFIDWNFEIDRSYIVMILKPNSQ